MRVLVVDDDASNRYLLESVVRSGGHEVVSAADGEEALEIARSNPPDVVITDILMPRMDGYQLCRSWKTDDVLKTKPLVFYTASYTDPEDERFALELGADAFWRKPLDPLTLLEKLGEVAKLAGSPEEVRAPEIEDEHEVLVEYNARLVHKIEQKAAELQRANEELRRAMQMLAEEVEVKANLIAELNADVAKRKALEAELRAERDFTRSVVDVPDVAVVALDSSGTVMLFSKGAEALTGVAAGDAVGRTLEEALGLADDCNLAAAVRAGASVRLREEIVSRWGEPRIVAWTVSASEGRVYLFGQDVTETQRAQAVDRIVAEVNARVASGAPIADILLQVCEAAASGLPRCTVAVALLGVDGAATVEADGLADAVEAIRSRATPWQAIPGGERVLDGETVVLAAEEPGLEIGSPLWNAGVRGVALVPMWIDGVVAGAAGYFAGLPHGIDESTLRMLERLTASVATAIALARSREEQAMQSAALASAADGIAIVDERGMIVSCNRALARLTGYSEAELLGRDIADLHTAAESEGWLFVLGGVAESWTGDTIGLRKDGSRYYERMSVAPVDGVSRPRFVVVKRDVTDERMLDQLRSGFVANVSHELRTPLTSILGYAELLSNMHPGDLAGKAADVARKIEASAIRMRDLVEELLEATTIQAEGGLKLLKRPADLEQVVRLRAEAVPRSAEHVLVVDAQPDMPLVVCDPDRIGRVVENLVSNAVKFSPEGGTVTVRVGVEGGEAFIAVSDQGVGIRSEDAPKLFDRFTQADMSSTRRFGGLGVGLFVADEIVRAHGGRIEVASEVGRGSTFTVRLPLEEPAGE
ncbi:ATP-binding protein [Coriobacteriia bacterium Es71-Z0120]|uniref:ATP-binding protein n=1 Tax=Parvivirga hydrogeniphila TaxID=2939460 RepID=UPI0022608C1E|nr:ATP-binding protein [Parvivirga hydrogeniphila]MCL4079082.1 ATP-binding protein [Parvivirga hydrogeniphila]